MKRRSFILLIAAVLLMISLSACGPKTDFEYEKTEGGVVITGYNGEDKEIVIPEEIGGKAVVAIGNAAFDMKQITSVEIPESVTAIGKYAFRRCGKLTSVTIKGKLTEIADGVFHYCGGLEKITLPDTVERIGINAFCMTGLKEIELPDSVKTIDAYAFYECHELEGFTAGKGLESIGECAFAACAHLNKLTLPEGLKSVGDYAFSSCVSLGEIKLPSTVDTLSAGVFAGMPYEEYTVQPSVKTIKAYAFQSCIALKKIYIPESVENIEADAFIECKGVTICGVRDSAAEIFADTYGFKFEEYTFN